MLLPSSNAVHEEISETVTNALLLRFPFSEFPTLPLSFSLSTSVHELLTSLSLGSSAEL